MWQRPRAFARPQSVCTPQLWRYAAARALLLESAQHISHDDAERRVLILENPGLAGRWILSPTLFAGLQLLMPGEVAPPHRHTQAALRFVLEGVGAFATVGDERIALEAGDLVVNPRWDWHSHEHTGAQGKGAPVLWLDVLDNPIVRAFEADFRQWPSDATPPAASDARASARRFPYPAAREALMRNGGSYEYPMGLPTISTRLRRLNSSTGPYRSTETLLLLVAEGTATVATGEQTWTLSRHDLAFIPPWTSYVLDGEAILFCASNRAALERLELFREE